MAKFFPGQRIKKVRGVTDIGATATVIEYITPRDEFDLLVQPSRPWTTTEGVVVSPLFLATTISALWEPVIDKHEPCDAEFKQSLDQLLARTKQDA